MKAKPVVVSSDQSFADLGNAIIKGIGPLVARGVHLKKEFVIRGVPDAKGDFTFTIEPNEDLVGP